MPVKIHPTAVVEPGAELADNIEVGPHCFIESGAVIGEGTEIGSSVWISGFVRMGKGNCIFHGAAIGGPPQDLKFGGEESILEIGDRNTIREYVTMNRGTIASGKTVVGSDNLFMAYTHVAHDCLVGSHITMANCAGLGGHVTVEDRVIIGGNVPIHQFCKIGENVMIGLVARISRDIPPYLLVGSQPTKVAGINVIGLRRRGFDDGAISALKSAFKLVYRSDLNLTQALEAIREEVEITPEVRHFIEFIEGSERGILR